MARWGGTYCSKCGQPQKNVLMSRCPALNAEEMLLLRFRSFMASARAAKLAQKRYRKCLEESTGATYYFNVKTGESLVPTSEKKKKKKCRFLFFVLSLPVSLPATLKRNIRSQAGEGFLHAYRSTP